MLVNRISLTVCPTDVSFFCLYSQLRIQPCVSNDFLPCSLQLNMAVSVSHVPLNLELFCSQWWIFGNDVIILKTHLTKSNTF